MITASDIRNARADMAQFLTDTCELFKLTRVVQNSGSTKDTYVSQGQIPCLIYLTSKQKLISEIGSVGEARADVAAHIFRLPWDTAIEVGDKLVANGSEFLVVSESDSDTNRVLLSVGAQRIRGNK